MTRYRTEAVPAAAIHGEPSAPPLFSRAQENGKYRSAPGGIFLTGGTGFLGRELVARLLARSGDEPIYLLIRGRDNTEVQRRFLALCNSVGSRWSDSDQMRIRPIRGDITLPWAGLDRKGLQELAGRVTRIVHAGASINLNSSLEEARRTNLGGAREILRLALSCRRLQSLVWISTAFVAGDRKGRILEKELQCGQKFRNAYEQSKFEAEFMARSFKALLPITIFRPSIIVGDSRDGHTCNFASIYWPLRLIAEGGLRRMPGNPLTPLDLVPVDYVADAIVELMAWYNSTGLCYQLVAGRSGTITAQELVNRAIRYFDPSRKPLRFISPCAQTNEKLRVFFSYLDDKKEFDDSATRAALRGTGLQCPRITNYLDQLFAFCERTGWGERSRAVQYRIHSQPRPCWRRSCMLTRHAVSKGSPFINVKPETIASAAACSPGEQKRTLTPILKRPVFERLIFAQCWEDPDMDAESLCLQPGKTALVVTSGGCTVLSLALLQPDRIFAVDLNAAQSNLLRLKIAGAKRLTHPEYLELLGVRLSKRRRRLYAQCRTALPPFAAAYWDAHQPLIEAGILRAGRYERYLDIFRRLLILIEGRRKVKQLFTPRSLEDRRRFYEELWNTHLWRLCFRFFFSRPVLGAMGLDRSFFTYVDGIEDFGAHFLRLTRHALVDISPHENYFAAQICLGGYLDERTMPPYLRAENYQTLQSAVDVIDVRTVELGAFLARMPDCSIDAFAFSNIFEWMSSDIFEECLRQTHRVARPDARFCYRNLLVRRQTPSALSSLFHPETALARRLLAEDRSWVYSNFEVATVLKPGSHEWRSRQ